VELVDSEEHFRSKMTHLHRQMRALEVLRAQKEVVVEMAWVHVQCLAVGLQSQGLRIVEDMEKASNNFPISEVVMEFGCTFHCVGQGQHS
jgi:hypothetical protein